MNVSSLFNVQILRRAPRVHLAGFAQLGSMVLAIAMVAPATAQPETEAVLSAIPPADAETLNRLDVAALKLTYLACDIAASERVLAFAEVATCSQVSEALLKRCFGGDFAQLLAWWRDEKALREATKVGLR